MNIIVLVATGIILIVDTILMFVIDAKFKKNKNPENEAKHLKIFLIMVVIMIVCFIVFMVSFINIGGSGQERTMGKCWVCGKRGSFQLDGSYYCFEHYNDRLYGTGVFG